METKTTHGGRREGAGRKPLPPHLKRHPIVVRINDQEEQVILEAGNGNITAGVRAIIADYINRHEN